MDEIINGSLEVDKGMRPEWEIEDACLTYQHNGSGEGWDNGIFLKVK